MTRNLMIATLFLLASTLLLGGIWVRENYVLADRGARFSGALMQRGARDYEPYCSGCHGLTGEGGVKGTPMPRWSNRFGGPLRDDQIVNIAAYVTHSGATEIPQEAQQVAASF